MSGTEIASFLKDFQSDSYNRLQIGNSKQLIIKIYEYMKKLDINKKTKEDLINNIAYLRKDEINLPLLLELISKSLDYISEYDLSKYMETIVLIHDLYNNPRNQITLEEYIHETEEYRTRQIFLSQNNKYLYKDYTKDSVVSFVNDIKFAAAIILEQREYQDFIRYFDEDITNQTSYSPIIVYKTYNRIRKKLKGQTKLFWDILFGNEYQVALIKHNLSLKELLSTNKDYFQIKNIYNNYDYPNYNTEKEFISYYERGIRASKDKKFQNRRISTASSILFKIK